MLSRLLGVEFGRRMSEGNLVGSMGRVWFRLGFVEFESRRLGTTLC